jgi:hypothetical protein
MKEQIPDEEGCFNLSVGGYGGCSTTMTNKQRILSPTAWAEMKNGEGYWLKSRAIANLKKFVLNICAKTASCTEEGKREISKKFDLFLTAPQIIEGKKEPQ